jgi:hypothetical protein
MSEYRIYTIGRDGRFSNAVNIECADDHEAIEKTRQAIDGRDVELWQLGRFIARFSHKDSQELKRGVQHRGADN